jgi:His/Glu/Gln/Arg/opine family amino acid ABC transporter permease subunit
MATTTPKPAIAPRSTVARQALRDFPWWIVIILAALLIWGLFLLADPARRAQYADAFRFISAGVGVTLTVTFAAYFLALVIGLVVGILRLSSNPVVYHVTTVYVEVMRGLPMLVIVLYAGFVIRPAIRDATGGFLDPSMLVGAIVGLGVGYGAFMSEIFRSGIQSIGRGQTEAAKSLGMNYLQSMRYVILPQAIRIILPPLGNDLIALLKDSALVAVLAIPDVLQLGRLWISRTFQALIGYNTVAIIYLGLTVGLSVIVGIIERRVRTGGR